MPLTEGLGIVHNALVGTGLRDRVKTGASGKIATGTDIVKRLTGVAARLGDQ
jgi:glutamate synthase domain-containing protein 2